MINPWPKKSSAIPKYSKLIGPIKSYIFSRYRIIRKQEADQFLYDGYNLGSEELLNYPDADQILANNFEERAAKTNTTPLDLALWVCFALGVECGRRKERHKTFSEKMLHKLLIKRTNDIKVLKLQLEELEHQQNAKQARC